MSAYLLADVILSPPTYLNISFICNRFILLQKLCQQKYALKGLICPVYRHLHTVFPIISIAEPSRDGQVGLKCL